ncbi:family 20 glycosylhydrolase [Leifsonia xyli]|uniref:family 20 glycosylhydrolase n=1 Tax=Leifsonia xyli TaxID=1575 RepID=UPI001CB7F4D5|nr:family 20 glycosylhydrolase [Leifsonia xyli]
MFPAAVYRAAALPGVYWAAPACEVRDAAAFRWRGVMLDVVRHFLPKRELLRYVDLIALHRFNILHLHLTDDQGWRMQIERYRGSPAWVRGGPRRRSAGVRTACDDGADDEGGDHESGRVDLEHGAGPGVGFGVVGHGRERESHQRYL